jgi:hypothetical protein
MSNNPNAWEEPYVQEVANRIVLENLSVDDPNCMRIMMSTLYTYRPEYPHAMLNSRVIKLIVDYVKNLRKSPPVNTTAVPSGADVFQGPPVQSTLIDTDDDRYLYATRAPGKKDTWHKRVTSMFGMTSKKPIATPVGGKRKTRKAKKSKKSRRHRKKRV